MKKIAKVFALAVMLVMGGQAMAQYRGSIHAGASFPMNDFGEFHGFDEFALMKVDEVDAGAGIGINAGLKWYFNLGVDGLNVLLAVDGFYNGPCQDLKTTYRDYETSYDFGDLIGGRFMYEATPKYINMPVMIGLNYIYHFNDSFGLFAEAGAGGNLRLITALETVEKGQFLGQEGIERNRTSYDSALSFAYQAGVGFEIGKNLVIECSFYDLGKAEVNTKHTEKFILNQNVHMTTEYNNYGSVHPVMVVGSIGFCF